VWRPITDGAEASWRVTYEKHSGKRVGRDAFSDYVRDLAHTNTHEPFVDYFDSLTQYDPAEGDHIARFAEFIATPQPELYLKHLRKWLVNTYACAYYDAKSHGHRNRNEHFLVIVGDQGVGKTTYLRALVPEKLASYTLEKPVKECKDSEQELAQTFVFQDDELRSLGAAEVETVKALLSKASFLFRPPYGKHPEEFPRRVSFCGSTNAREFLRDPTGSRRFFIHEVIGFVRTQELAGFDVSRLWAQARHLYEEGFRYYLTPEEIAEVERHNADYTAPTTEEDLLLRYFEPVEWKGAEASYFTTSELAMRISLLHDREHTKTESMGIAGDREVRDGVPRYRYESQAAIQRLGALLHKLGFKRGTFRSGGTERKKWAVLEKPRHKWSSET
jgi:predicted P-loop ATPase